MKFLLRILDAEGRWIRRVFDPQNQIRLGAMMLNLGIVMHLAGPLFPSEPPVIYHASAGALDFGGIGVIVTAVLAKKHEEET